jgi:hypothetical protein
MRTLLGCSLCCLVFGVAAVLGSAAVAADQPGGGSQMSMEMPGPGPESKALQPFFGKSLGWTGTCPAGSMGPGSPQMESHGKASCRPLFDGFSYAIDVEDTFGSGKDAMTWMGHMVVGYVVGAKAYRGFSSDNTGELVMWNGTLDGNKFVLESAAPFMMMGQMMDDRLSWVRNSDGTLAFTDEHRPQGGDWVVGEAATMK